MKARFLTGLAVAALVLGFMPAAASATASFTPLGFLSGKPKGSVAQGISADGSTVVGVSTGASGNDEAFRWTASGGMVGLGTISGYNYSDAVAASANGSTITGQSSDTTTINGPCPAFVWTASGGMVGIGPGPGGCAIGIGVSADGSVIVGQLSASGGGSYSPFRWTASGGMVSLGSIPGIAGGGGAIAKGVSADGSTVAGYAYDSYGNSQAFRWTASTGTVGLGQLPGGSGSAAEAITADGSTIIGTALDSAGVGELFRWTASGGMVGLPGTSGSSLIPSAISGDGSVIVGYSLNSATGKYEAMIWDATHGTRNLAQVLSAQGIDLTGWDLQYATGISADGSTIAGYGLKGPIQEAFVAVLPEPSTDALLLAALLGLAVVGRRRAGEAG